MSFPLVRFRNHSRGTSSIGGFRLIPLVLPPWAHGISLYPWFHSAALVHCTWRAGAGARGGAEPRAPEIPRARGGGRLEVVNEAPHLGVEELKRILPFFAGVDERPVAAAV